MDKRINKVEMLVAGRMDRGRRGPCYLFMRESTSELFRQKYGTTWDFPDLYGRGTDSGVPDTFVAHNKWVAGEWSIGRGHTLPEPRVGEIWIVDIVRLEDRWLCLPVEFVGERENVTWA